MKDNGLMTLEESKKFYKDLGMEQWFLIWLKLKYSHVFIFRDFLHNVFERDNKQLLKKESISILSIFFIISIKLAL